MLSKGLGTFDGIGLSGSGSTVLADTLCDMYCGLMMCCVCPPVQVDGDVDSEEQEEEGMGDIDVEAAALTPGV
jgi:hypothetical protein